MIDPSLRMQFMLTLRNKGLTDREVLSAIEQVPRHEFIEGHFQKHAYEDIALPIACGQTISQPSVVCHMTQALLVNKRHKVLEIGTGSGYQAAVLSKLARRVYSIERHKSLARDATRRLNGLQIPNVTVLGGDGTLGLPDQSPFDRIIVSAAAEDIPSILLDQLNDNGIMVLPVGPANNIQTILRVQKTADGLEYTEFQNVRFVPLVEGVAED
ncbi:MAG: protein-L-isoaspartate(D-aspartate) O-methyltransferase [Pseudomonadota bacterium]